MLSTNDIVTVFVRLTPEKPSIQVIELIRGGCFSVDSNNVLAQFKYCVKNKIYDSNYQVLRSYLLELVPEETVKKMEDLGC